jgi:hypothetical protein
MENRKLQMENGQCRNIGHVVPSLEVSFRFFVARMYPLSNLTTDTACRFNPENSSFKKVPRIERRCEVIPQLIDGRTTLPEELNIFLIGITPKALRNICGRGNRARRDCEVNAKVSSFGKRRVKRYTWMRNWRAHRHTSRSVKSLIRPGFPIEEGSRPFSIFKFPFSIVLRSRSYRPCRPSSRTSRVRDL